MSIDINLVKQLRKATMASLSECKKALVEAEGDYDSAITILRETGALKAAKKADRETSEGAVLARKHNGLIAVAVVYCETDFVANNENFVALVESILDLLASNGIAPSMDDLNSQTQQSIDSLIQEHVLTLGENIQLGKAFVTDRSGFIYNHTGNNISTIVYGNGSDDVLKEVALQITAMNPQYLSRDDVPNDIIDSLRAAAEQELEGDNKPDDIKTKIIEGKITKGLEDIVLLEQSYIRESNRKVKDILNDSTIEGYDRLTVA